jgi:hypothetical protein
VKGFCGRPCLGIVRNLLYFDASLRSLSVRSEQECDTKSFGGFVHTRYPSFGQSLMSDRAQRIRTAGHIGHHRIQNLAKLPQMDKPKNIACQAWALSFWSVVSILMVFCPVLSLIVGVTFGESMPSGFPRWNFLHSQQLQDGGSFSIALFRLRKWSA